LKEHHRNLYGENEQHIPDRHSSIIQTQLKRPRQQIVSEDSTWLIRHRNEPKKKTMEDILGEISTAREEFLNTMRETHLKRDR